MGTLTVLALVTVVFAGCVQPQIDQEQAPAALKSLQVYEYRYGLDDAFSPAVPHGWMVQVTNPTDDVVEFRYEMLHNVSAEHGPATDDGWMSASTPEQAPKRVRIKGGTSVAYLFQAQLPANATNVTYALQVLDADQNVVEQQVFQRELTPIESVVAVAPGHHVQTVTVGVFSNGTSFYTNIADLFEDEAFPHYTDDDEFDATPLPIYVFRDSRDEQPARSKDTCHFTTVTGYNALLKTQVLGSTGVRWLAPEEGYTVDGREDHFLYGEDLIFLNTVVAHDGGTTMRDQVPDPTADCFDPDRYSPVPPPQSPLLHAPVS